MKKHIRVAAVVVFISPTSRARHSEQKNPRVQS